MQLTKIQIDNIAEAIADYQFERPTLDDLYPDSEWGQVYGEVLEALKKFKDKE